MELVAATGNKHKVEEFRRILEPLGIQVLTPFDCGISLEGVEETGATFMDNARIKAQAVLRLTGKPAFADDSGLCVDALDGRPGVHSARYWGEDTTYPEKMAALLKELEGIPQPERGACFVSAICCCMAGEEITAEGVCSGFIGFAPAGEGGFGFDPLFLVGTQSFAQLPPEEKDRISHRGRSLREFAAKLETYMKRKEGPDGPLE